MTDKHNNQSEQPPLDAALAALATSEREHRAPATLRAAISRDVHRAISLAATEPQPGSGLQDLLEWISGHWWRALSMGSMAAAIPLLAGALLGYQFGSEGQSLDDPAIDWLASYSTSADITDEGAPGELLP